ncbi:hypothetical protein V5E97_26440 [Singulisphaera sp. Ch08]|uniref:Uncharacterized protein n=1 Tax=Singulisphaera sp. Ch08 TaxID=3120278 RepID=A0AAU7C8W8_9BACT
MKIGFSQIYVEPSACFPFSHLFQRRLSEEVTALVEPSALFVERYGEDFELMFRISAKQALDDTEIRGPTVFKKTKDVEYTTFLPFAVIMRQADAPRHAIIFLLKGVYEVFDLLDISKFKLLDKQAELIEGICSDPTMLRAPSWNEADNKTHVRAVFEAFFRQGGG